MSRLPATQLLPRQGGDDVTVLRPRRGLVALQFRELWEYREVGLFLMWRDLKVRFRQTALGVLWAILQPLLLTLIFTIFLNRVAGVYAYDIPYALFALSVVVPWTLFSRALATSSSSLVESSSSVESAVSCCAEP